MIGDCVNKTKRLPENVYTIIFITSYDMFPNSRQQKQTEFDKDVFAKLVEKVVVNNREDITFVVFKDETEIKAEYAE
jgi:hypothetical protein